MLTKQQLPISLYYVCLYFTSVNRTERCLAVSFEVSILTAFEDHTDVNVFLFCRDGFDFQTKQWHRTKHNLNWDTLME